MIKKLRLILVTVLMLIFCTACADTGKDSYVPLENNAVTDLSENQIKALDWILDEYMMERYIHPVKIDMLEEKDWYISTKHWGQTPDTQYCVEKADNSKGDFRLKYSKGWGVKSITYTGRGFFTFESKNGTFGDFSIYLGSFNSYGDSLVHTYRQRIAIVEPGYSERADDEKAKLIQVTGLGDDFWLVDCIPDETGFFTAYVTPEEQGFVYIDKEGRASEQRYILPNNHIAYISDELIDGGYGEKGYNRPVAVKNAPHMMWLDKEKENILFISAVKLDTIKSDSEYGYHAFVYNLKTGRTAKPVLRAASTGNYFMNVFDRQFLLFTFEDMEYTTDARLPYTAVAITLRDGQRDKFFTFDADIIADGYTFSYAVHGHSFDKFECYDKNAYGTLTVDFNSETVKYLYTPATERVANIYSENSIYRIIGEYIKNNESERYYRYRLVHQPDGRSKLLAKVEDTGIKVQTGFLPDGNVYIFTQEDYKVFDTDMGTPQPVFSLSDIYPTGANRAKGVYYRCLVNCRRDPYTGDVLFVYFDLPYADEDGYFLDSSKDTWQLDATYKVALLDADGYIAYNHDTGVPVLTFGKKLDPVKISMPTGTTLKLESGFNHENGITYFSGILNLETGKYTAVDSFNIEKLQNKL